MRCARARIDAPTSVQIIGADVLEHVDTWTRRRSSELPAHHLRELMHDRNRVVRLEVLDVAFGQGGEVRKHTEVGFHPALDTILLNLDHDVLAAVQARVLHLRDRR